MEKLTLTKTNHFSHKSLVDYLNKKAIQFGKERIYTFQDITGYLNRGRLPSYMGSQPIKEDEFNGIKYIAIK